MPTNENVQPFEYTRMVEESILEVSSNKQIYHLEVEK